MEQQRYVETGNNSFYGEYLYDQVVPQDHFLRKLRQIIDWNRFTRKLIKLFDYRTQFSSDISKETGIGKSSFNK